MRPTRLSLTRNLGKLSDRVRENVKSYLGVKNLPQGKAKAKVIEMFKYKTDQQRQDLYKKLDLSYEDKNKLESRIQGDHNLLSAEIQKEFKEVPLKFWPKEESKTEINEAWRKFKAFKNRNITYALLQDSRQREKGVEGIKRELQARTAYMSRINVEDKAAKGAVVSMLQRKTPVEQNKNGGKDHTIKEVSTVPVAGQHSTDNNTKSGSNVIHVDFNQNKG